MDDIENVMIDGEHMEGEKPREAEGPPVVLFPSLAGSVLEAHESPVDGWGSADNNGVPTRIWMSLRALSKGSVDNEVLIQDSETSAHRTSNAFVQHMALNPHSNGEDPPGFKVRAKPGLDGCEYLSDDLLAKNDTAIMGVITDMLRPYGYTEYNPETHHGSMIGASYDWRVMPAMMESRDGFFTKTMELTEVAPISHARRSSGIHLSLYCPDLPP